MLLGERLRAGDVVLLTGELGAGKTTFVRGVAQGTGSQAPVASPTFQLVRIYPGRVQLAHVDLYRTWSGQGPGRSDRSAPDARPAGGADGHACDRGRGSWARTFLPSGAWR